MKLYYYTKDDNFGDRINSWLWERLLPGYWSGEGPLFSAIGTLLGASLPAEGHVIVFSSGVGYGALPDFQKASVEISCVRGPLSARALALPPDTAVTDGAALLATLEAFTPATSSRRRGIVFMPHHGSEYDDTYRDICREAGIDYLSPRADSLEAVDRIRHAELVLADAMHAAIVADSLRVPWIPVVTSSQISAFKWLDWTGSLSLPYAPVVLGQPSCGAWLRGLSMGPLGEANYFPPSDTDAAMRHYAAQNRLHRNRKLRWVQMKGGHARNRLLSLVDKAPGKSWRRDMDRRLADKVAASLDAASRTRPFLSPDAIFSSRLRELSKRLDAIARAYSPTKFEGRSRDAVPPMRIRA